MSDEDDFVVEGPELAEDDPMRAFLPASFGKKSKEANIAAQIDRSRRTTEKASAGGSKEGSAVTATQTRTRTIRMTATITPFPMSWY
ncbi:hypothetical protein CGGC5_v007520 [Colletotrichum fructicola Nara gc5]|uniref:Uncharacterized protein n=1 Tax=Colletotrichum fructicola (strain Nara gc5) TaxID=1213859 RepID=A0A7J6J526_COLFN|nr:hypothetical protein CGGC5_v007520 [Colletotrichum fructicola Nara gc5]KAF5499137.1 hypothetical protein CGCF413_v006799 [Colletotrichum fructicola]